MTAHHKYANPVFARPLTKAEGSGIANPTTTVPKNEIGTPINCSKCRQPGGTLCKTPGTKTGYTHQACLVGL